MNDYYVSATVTNRDDVFGRIGWRLWTARIQAHGLSDARAHAYLLIEQQGLSLGELQVMWDAAPAITAPAFTDSNLTAPEDSAEPLESPQR